MVQRIVQGLSATLTHTFYVDGVATDPSPDSATIAITRDNGTVLVAAGTATTNAGVGVVSYTLTPAQAAMLDVLTVVWTATFGGQPQTFSDRVEVVGGVLFTIAEARALPALANTTTYPTSRIMDARTMVETALEDACGVAFVPRYGKTTVSGAGSSLVLLPPRLRAIRSVTRDGTALTSGELADLRVLPTGEAYMPGSWMRGFANYVITYEHGHDFPPPRVSHAALKLARRYLVESPVSDRATSLTTEDGSTQFLVTAGVRQAIFDIPEANAVVEQYSLGVCVA